MMMPTFTGAVGDVLLETLPWSGRTRSVLRNRGLVVVADLTKLRETDLLKMKEVGRKTIEEIREVLGTLGQSLVEEPPRDQVESLARILARLDADDFERVIEQARKKRR